MTNPYSGGNDDFPRYEPTDHPEDRPNYGHFRPMAEAMKEIPKATWAIKQASGRLPERPPQ